MINQDKWIDSLPINNKTLNEKGNQPMEIGNKILMCNGEIYNYKEIAEKYNFNLITGSDCEIIIHLSNILPISKYIHMLDGVFSFIIYDKAIQCLTIGHDPLGVRPLYWYKNYQFTFSLNNFLLLVFSHPIFLGLTMY